MIPLSRYPPITTIGGFFHRLSEQRRLAGKLDHEERIYTTRFNRLPALGPAMPNLGNSPRFGAAEAAWCGPRRIRRPGVFRGGLCAFVSRGPAVRRPTFLPHRATAWGGERRGCGRGPTRLSSPSDSSEILRYIVRFPPLPLPRLQGSLTSNYTIQRDGDLLRPRESRVDSVLQVPPAREVLSDKPELPNPDSDGNAPLTKEETMDQDRGSSKNWGKQIVGREVST